MFLLYVMLEIQHYGWDPRNVLAFEESLQYMVGPCLQVFGEFLQYMYTGNIHLNNSSVLPVLTLADKYNIHDLGKVCRQYMACHCHASLPNLKVTCLQLICRSTLIVCTIIGMINILCKEYLNHSCCALSDTDKFSHVIQCKIFHIVIDLRHWCLVIIG